MSPYNFLSTSSFAHGLVSYSLPCPCLCSDILQESTSTAPISTSTILLCSAVSKMTASIATYPHEVVRTRLQIQRRFLPGNGITGADAVVHSTSKDTKRYKGLVHAAERIVREEGWRGLYKGLSINLFRTVPNSAVTMLTYVPVFVKETISAD
jgi:solute carrier family 25 (mitochondrial folate transporter), member 32